MSLSYQILRNTAHQRRNFCTLYALKIPQYNQDAAGCGVYRSRGLHSIAYSSRVPDIGKKFEGIAITRLTHQGRLFRNATPLTPLVVFARNESTNSTGRIIPNSIPETQVLSSNPATTAHVGESIASQTIPESTAALDAAFSIQSPLSDVASSPPANPVEVPHQEALVFESIPEPPSVPLPVDEVTGAVLGEPTLASMGLAGWSPAGIIQQCLEFFHINLGMPWWGSILTGTIIVRLLLFPLVVKSQRNAAKMQNYMPELQVLQEKMTEARNTGNALLAAKYGQDMAVFMKEKDINPLKSLIVPMAMAPVFISFFFGLRKMANLPVESMKEGGMFWFMDLTVADPYYLLPLITSVTVWVTLEIGVDGMKLNSAQYGQIMKYFMRAIPLIMFPFTLNFPAAILCYWVSTNGISLIQVSCLKIPAVREYLKIEAPRKIAHDIIAQSKKKGFKENFKESWTNMKITREIEDRQRYDEISFKRAGRGPIPKTYKYDPTKVDPSAVQAKQK